MSFPTQEPIPRILGTDVRGWVERVVEFLQRNMLSLALPVDGLLLADGVNNNIAVANAMMLNIKGPINPFTITGIGSGSSGRILVIYNLSAGTMTIADDNAGSAIANRIRTFVGDLVCSIALFVYNEQDSHWLMLAAR